MAQLLGPDGRPIDLSKLKEEQAAPTPAQAPGDLQDMLGGEEAPSATGGAEGSATEGAPGAPTDAAPPAEE